jgi:hypothetical protein
MTIEKPLYRKRNDRNSFQLLQYTNPNKSDIVVDLGPPVKKILTVQLVPSIQIFKRSKI